MKKFLSRCFIILITGLFSSEINANPILVNDVCFSELAFDSTGWKLELCIKYWEEVTISFKGWYLVSGNDTAYFQDWMHISNDYFFVSEDSLIGHLKIDYIGDTIFLYDNDGYQEDYLVYGPDTYNSFPPLQYGQSLCNFHYFSNYYLDNSHTIGSPNDTIDATGVIHGYVFDANGRPAVYQIVHLNGFYPSHPARENRTAETDSSGYFILSTVYATYNSLFVQNMNSPYNLEVINIHVLPGKSTYAEIYLDWLTGIKDKAVLPGNYSLEHNYPNPFNPATTICYTIPTSPSVPLLGKEREVREMFVELKVYDVLGREVTTLVNKEQSPGNYKVEFDANGLSSGIYFYILQVSNSAGIEGFTEVKKMMVLK